MPTYEGLRLKILKLQRKCLANYRNKKIINKEFTIISNNCWGGMIYESYNLPKQTPTVGLYIMPSDYIKFISNLNEYLKYKIEFISINESKWKNDVIKNDSKVGQYPIGRLKDIEIFFLHYRSEEEVLQKWERRCKRINWNKIIYKFNDQNGCTQYNYDCFNSLKLKNKLFFTCKKWDNTSKDSIYIKKCKNSNGILASYEPFGNSKYININDFINKI